MDKAPLRPKLIHGKVWVPSTDSGYRKLPEDDPSYKKIYDWIDSRRFVELLDWVYHREDASKTAITPIKTVIKTANDREKWKGMNEASFNRKLRRLQNAEARARRLREELDSARETWQRNYDKLTPLWIAYRTAHGENLEYEFNDILSLTEAVGDRSMFTPF